MSSAPLLTTLALAPPSGPPATLVALRNRLQNPRAPQPTPMAGSTASSTSDAERVSIRCAGLVREVAAAQGFLACGLGHTPAFYPQHGARCACAAALSDTRRAWCGWSPSDGAPFGVPAAENKSQSAPDPKGPTSAKEDFGYMAAPSRRYRTLAWLWHNLRCEGVEGLMGGDGDVAVRVPRLLVTRLRVLLARRHKQRSISQRMVEREIVRRLRVSFAIDDLVEDHSDA